MNDCAQNFLKQLFTKRFDARHSNASTVYGGTSEPSPIVKMSTYSNGHRDSVQATSIHDPLLYEADNPMSKDRRKFVIICCFDCTLITILWLISTVSKGADWPQIFLDEINIFASDFFAEHLFDIVLLGVFRTAMLLTFYACIRVDHWLPVACTTSISTIFLVIKILFFFKKNHGGLAQVVLLASLSAAWFELWVMPFRVLSRERRAHDNVSIGSSSRSSAPNSFFRPNRLNRRRMIATAHPTTDDEFRSALEYTTDEERSPQIALNPTINLPRFGCILRQSAYATLDSAYRQVVIMASETPAWKVVNNLKMILELCFWLLGVMSRCGIPQLGRMDYLYKFDAERDIVHSESTSALGGYVSPRHFIDIRRVVHDAPAESYTCVYVSIPTQDKPEESSGGVRGINGPNLVRITKLADKKTLFEWIMNSDLKSKIPKSLLRNGTISFLATYPKIMEKFMAEKLEHYMENAV
ncbi:hypothetical protein M3Y97_00801300 [Aphelenchoides bicaudatus]|nr:hypothetical protein M3Y97_00801300 [Aphelenchoides bicaudatus]